MLVDSHAHLDFVEDLEGVLGRAKEAGVEKIISVGTTIEESERIIQLAEKHSTSGLTIWTTAGIHPNDGKEEVKKMGINELIHRLREIIKSSKKVVAIGEAGLDYYLGFRGQGSGTSDEEKKIQKELFVEQIKLADELSLPLVIHCRNGWSEIFELLTNVKNYSSSETEDRIEKFSTSSNNKQSMLSSSRVSLRASNNKLRGVFHSWTGNWNDAKRALDLGFYISFSGIVTFTNAREIQEVAKKIPIDRILVETDSPYLSPEPFRGSTNEPKNVKIVAQFIADLRNQTVDELSSRTSANARKLFKLL